MGQPDRLSVRVIAAISPEEAGWLVSDPVLRAECEKRGVALEPIIASLRHPADERLRRADLESSHRTFFRFLDALGHRGIRFVVIGGMAARIYGSTFATEDCDICHARDEENLDRLATFLRGLTAEFRRPPAHAAAELSAEVFATETDFVFTTPWGKFDLIGEFTGVGRYEQAVDGSIPLRLGRHRARVLALDKLALAKKSTGRDKDQRVHQELEVVRVARELLDRSTSKVG
ncbi:MAG: hypothetical protein H0X45_15875 [Planctomycetes bacterium]|nr:hypothetical protein [Planctomycetota bacterium]